MATLEELEAKYAAPDLDALEKKYGVKQPVLLPDPKAMTPTADTLLPNPAAMVPGPAREKTTQGEAVAAHGIGGATLGFDDEAHGILRSFVEATGGAVPTGPPGSGLTTAPGSAPRAVGMGDYRQYRDERRDLKKRTAEDWPKTALAAEIGGGLATAPLTGGGGTARGLMSGVRAVGKGMVLGAASGLGHSEADLTKGDVRGALKDTGWGGLVGGAVAGAGEAVKAGVRTVAGAVVGGLRRRLMNEVAEGTSSTTPTARKWLDKAGDAVVRVVTRGPDARTVRGAYLGGNAQAGIDAIEPIVDRLTARNAANYARFERAGRRYIDLATYRGILQEAAQEATRAGQSRLAAGIERFAEHVGQQAERTGSTMALTQLRGLTTEAQAIASSVLGSLNEHINARVARQVEGVVTGAMSQTLHQTARGVPALERAARMIEANNQRLHGFLTVRDALARRAEKEASGKSWMVRNAEKVAGPAAAGAAMGAMGSDDKIEGALKGAAVGGAIRYGIPAAARAIDRGLTTAAIEGGVPVVPFLGQALQNRFGTPNPRIGARGGGDLANVLGRVAAGSALKKPDDEEEERRKRAAGVAP